jgi:hypothetical protein
MSTYKITEMLKWKIVLPVFWDEVKAESFVDAFRDSFDATSKPERFSRNDFTRSLSEKTMKQMLKIQ